MSYLKAILIFFLLVVFSFFALVLYPFYLLRRNSIRKLVSGFVQLTAIMILKVIGVKLDSNFNTIPSGGRLIICNHMSYLDMLIILSKVKTSFLTSNEIKETPFLGQICELAGCFYTERRNKDRIFQEVENVKNAISKGVNVTFFPEGTSTNASELKKFKRPFFYSAIGELKEIDVLSLNYISLDNQKFDRSNRDCLCWYDGTHFMTHLMRLLKLKEIKANLNYSVVKVQEDVHSLVDNCYQEISSKVKLI